ncbi:hypothetical protein M153_3810003178 [Pseudoloma neurophilia]|uniref:Uncharacterized protein n=1 Tax=Pseudoloma neurophilia TaxID=146866 RepID=A0A0R0LY34_9MICR|nr:hypothetical protein M153_3810003178 [Pseudoloma neurophilia]
MPMTDKGHSDNHQLNKWTNREVSRGMRGSKEKGKSKGQFISSIFVCHAEKGFPW